jgi:NAD(P)-dependent dehydrogenase (short-subunit alcohol dehydrogenase family)
MKTQPTIVITGASQGIGAGLVSRFLKRGYNVVATSRKVSASKEWPLSDRIVRVDDDVADPASAVVEAALKAFGSVDALSPIQGISRVDEIVDAVVFVTEAPRVTGETVRFDGGGHLGKW